MSEIRALTAKVLKFRDARNWKPFHNPKDVSLSLVLEAAELMEHFQWKSAEEVTAHARGRRGEIADEIADVFYWVLLLAHDLDIDLPKALSAKLRKNARKYPVRKAKNNSAKYTRL